MKEDMTAFFKYLKGCHTEKGQDLFSIVTEYGMENEGFKLQEGRI